MSRKRRNQKGRSYEENNFYKRKGPDFTARQLERAKREKQKNCNHASCRVEFDKEAAEGLDEYEIRKRWPRFEGICPDCGAQLILYASPEHFVLGDW